MNTEAEGYTQEELDGNAEAVRETVAEWMRLNADRIVSGEYMEDLPDGVEKREMRINTLANRALQATEIVRRIIPARLEAHGQVAEKLTRDVEEAARDAFAAVGMDREIPDAWMDQTIREARDRLETEGVEA